MAWSLPWALGALVELFEKLMNNTSKEKHIALNLKFSISFTFLKKPTINYYIYRPIYMRTKMSLSWDGSCPVVKKEIIYMRDSLAQDKLILPGAKFSHLCLFWSFIPVETVYIDFPSQAVNSSWCLGMGWSSQLIPPQSHVNSSKEITRYWDEFILGRAHPTPKPCK